MAKITILIADAEDKVEVSCSWLLIDKAIATPAQVLAVKLMATAEQELKSRSESRHTPRIPPLEIPKWQRCPLHDLYGRCRIVKPMEYCSLINKKLYDDVLLFPDFCPLKEGVILKSPKVT